ncbi:hypothetical protein CRUP_036167 [Coryphaenoides rupestris]|nr:hypothetical protein CRUP_036167 [Coryphaenoides rupestris]
MNSRPPREPVVVVVVVVTVVTVVMVVVTVTTLTCAALTQTQQPGTGHWSLHLTAKQFCNNNNNNNNNNSNNNNSHNQREGKGKRKQKRGHFESVEERVTPHAAMGNAGRVAWILVECTCRILGIATATVGVETLHQGQFHSLAVYLLCPPDWQLFVLWRKMARVDGFHKFLYYAIMSWSASLHPVWSGTTVIPGTMLLVTACCNFLLDKKPRAASSKGLREHYDEQGPSSIPPAAGGMESGKPQSTFCSTSSSSSSSNSNSSSSSFFRMGKGWKRGGGGEGGGLAEERVLALGEEWEEGEEEEEEGEEETGSARVVVVTLEPERAQKHGAGAAGRKWGWRERRQVCGTDRGDPGEREMEEMGRHAETEAETTSDTAP